MDRGSPRRRSLRSAVRQAHLDERGQSLAVVLTLITFLFLVGSAMAAHASVALRATAANEAQAGDLHAADAGAELGMWWQRNGMAGNPPPISVNGLTVTTTVGVSGGTPCPTRTPIRLTGFESGAVSISGSGLFSAVAGSGAATDASVVRSGARSLRITDPVGSANSVTIPSAGAVVVARVYLRLASLPAADVAELLVLDAAAGNDLRLGYQAATQRLTLRFGAAAVTVAGSAISAATWVRVDLRLTANANPRTADWQVDGAVQTALSSAGTASTVTAIRLGSTVAADTYTANYDDVMTSATTGDYPIGDGAVLPLRPDGMGTHNTPGSFHHEDGSAIGVTTHQRLDDDPMTSVTDYARQDLVGGTSYLELTFGNTSATCIVGVAGVVGYHSASAAANAARTSIVDGATERILFSGDMSEVFLFYKSAIVPATGTWTTAEVNALVGRIGYATDVSPNPYWDALLLEVATGFSASATITVTATAGASTVTAIYLDAGTSSPVLLSWAASQ